MDSSDLHEEIEGRLQEAQAELQLRRQFGRRQAPVLATHAYRLPLTPLRHNGLRVEKWVLVNDRRQTMTFLTTYNGTPGSNYDAQRNTRPFDLFELCARLKNFEQVPVEYCPVAIPETSLVEADGPEMENTNWR